MDPRILVINPNSTVAVTEGIDTALASLRMAGGPAIDCVTLPEGPPGIESQADVESVVQPICRAVQDHAAAAYVIACFSDPGLHLAREATKRPVFGIAECAMLTAMTRGERFGIIAILPASVPRHLRYVRALGLEQRFATSRPIGMGILELADEKRVMERMTAVGAWLRDERGADVAIMGCAGMARYKGGLEDALGLPVVEPTQAAATMAIGAVLLAGGP
ncbi:MAG: aspartate/glutamate racemase family protein [Kiloniellales bacterium]